MSFLGFFWIFLISPKGRTFVFARVQLGKILCNSKCPFWMFFGILSSSWVYSQTLDLFDPQAGPGRRLEPFAVCLFLLHLVTQVGNCLLLLFSYLVCCGLFDRLSELFHGIRKSVYSDVEGALLLTSLMNLASSATKSLQIM